MANISGQISLDAFVRRLLAKEGEDNDNYMRYMQIACDAIRDMHIHDFHIEVTKVVTVDSSTNTFSFPTDYVRYVAIATPIDGRWWTYTREDGMVPLNDDDTSADADPSNSVAIQTGLPNISELEPVHSLGQAGGHNEYYFREDRRNRLFQVAGNTPDTVVLKYVTNGIDADGLILLPDYSTLAIEDYVRWKLKDYDQDAESHIARLYAQYKLSRRKMRQVNRPTIDDIKDAIYRTSGALRR
jgi:hypothetical protein